MHNRWPCVRDLARGRLFGCSHAPLSALATYAHPQRSAQQEEDSTTSSVRTTTSYGTYPGARALLRSCEGDHFFMSVGCWVPSPRIPTMPITQMASALHKSIFRVGSVMVTCFRPNLEVNLAMATSQRASMMLGVVPPTCPHGECSLMQIIDPKA